MNWIVYVAAGLFFLMGVMALLRPRRVLAVFSMRESTDAMRNEVRAVYGGYGLAVALSLLVATRLEGLRLGILFAVVMSLFGMAVGRLVSIVIERPQGLVVYVFLVLEVAVGAALCYAWWIS